VHVVIMGCGRVGSTLARSLEDRNHTVSVIDSDADAFRRLYDPGRAEVYQRLGITTVATVKWTADQVLRRLLPAGAEPDFRDPSGTIRLDQVPVPETWIGHRTIDFQVQSRSRIAWIDRLGEGMLPVRETVLQEGDLLHLVMREENAAHAYTVIKRGPEPE
jgi:trk system potassium uptake protein TrkA